MTANGYRMPAEWERHRATWLAWPKANDNWPRHVFEVQSAYLRLIEAIVTGEDVCLLVDDAREEETVRLRLKDVSVGRNAIHYFHIPTQDVWIRDYGPNFVVKDNSREKEKAINDWEFNAWGGKYKNRLPDNKVPQTISDLKSLPIIKPGINLEGGAIDVNGEGLLVTTEQCLLNSNRNPHLTKNGIENYLKKYLGIKRVIWLGGGLEGDDTDGHIDEVARFVSKDTILLAQTRNISDTNTPVLEENLKRLEREHLHIIRLPLPKKIRGSAGILPASYLNFYITNTSVILPQFEDPMDQEARAILKEHFPGKNIVGIDSRRLLQGQGSFHCVTQQEPEGG